MALTNAAAIGCAEPKTAPNSPAITAKAVINKKINNDAGLCNGCVIYQNQLDCRVL